MCIELYLSRHINNDHVLFRKRLDGFMQEIQILHEKFKAIDQPPVRAKMHLLHDIFEGDEVFDVEVGLEREVLRSGIEVDVEAWTFDDAEMFNEGEAEGCLGSRSQYEGRHQRASQGSRTPCRRQQGP